MPKKIYRVKLNKDECGELSGLVNRGKGAAKKITRARVLLLSDENREEGGLKDAEISKVLGITTRTVERIRRNCVLNGIEAAITHAKPERTKRRVLDGAAEAELTRLACTQAPDGRVRWTLQLLRDKLVEMEVVDTISKETVRVTLKKTNLSLG